MIECLELPEDAFGNEAVKGFINKIWNIAPDFSKFREALSSTKSTRNMRWENDSKFPDHVNVSKFKDTKQ